MRSVSIGLIGAGVMGLDHAALIAGGTGSADLAVVHDPDPARAAAAVARFGCRSADTAEAVVADPAVDAVLVASPDPTHAPLVLACIAAGKPVLVEKPLAATLAACRTIVSAEIACGQRLVHVGYMRRYDPGYRAMRAALADQQLGAALFFHCRHRNAVGPDYLTSRLVIANSAVHEIDITRFVLGEEIAAATVVSPRASRRAPGRQPQFVILESASGVVVDVEAFVDAHYGYDVQAELVCEDGTLSLAPHRPLTRRVAGLDGAAVDQDWRDRFQDAYREQMSDWLRSVRDGGPSQGASAWDGFAASLVAEVCLDALDARQRLSTRLPERPAFYDQPGR